VKKKLFIKFFTFISDISYRCLRRYFIRSLLIILIIILIIAAIVLVLLIKPKQLITTQSTILLFFVLTDFKKSTSFLSLRTYTYVLLLLLFFYVQDKIAVLRWNKTGVTVAGIIANPGNSSVLLNNPLDVKIDHAYNIYVVDRWNHRIQKYTFDNTTGQTIVGNGSIGPYPYQLDYPAQMIFDSNENFYISESYRQDILFWLNGGTSGTRVAGNGKKSNKDYYKNSFVIEFYYIKMNNVTVSVFFFCCRWFREW